MPHDTPRGPAARLVTLSLRRPIAVVLVWIAASAALTLGVPTLEQAVSRSAVSALPAGAPSSNGLRVMDDAFGSGRAEGFAFIVLADRRGLTPADQAAYRRLVRGLRADRSTVAEVQDYVTTPKFRDVLTSHDHQVTYVPVGITAKAGSAQALEQVDALRAHIVAARIPAGTDVYLTGDPAAIADLLTAVNHTADRITVVSVLLVVLVLLLIYRRLVTILIPLATIGVAAACSRGLLALLGTHGMTLSSFTAAFVLAVVLGAGTDYSVFLISRFREEFRNGGDAQAAVRLAGGRVGGALLASAGTVILGCSALGFTHLANFSTTGPPMAVGVAVTVLVSLTLTPVLTAWAATRIGPAPHASRRRLWARTGRYVANRTGRVLAAGTLLLVLLALALPGMRLSFDLRSSQPRTTESNRGLDVLEAHFPAQEVTPDYVLISTNRDLRNPADLAALNTVSTALTKVPGVGSIRSITQPAGRPIPQARLSAQLAQLATQLRTADRKLSSGRPGLDRFRNGTSALADGAQQLAAGAKKATSAADRFAAGLQQLSAGLVAGGTKSTAAVTGARELRDGAAQLATALQTAHDQTAPAVEGVGTIASALQRDLLCTVDPVCNRARTALATIYDGEKNQLLPGLQKAADAAAQLASGTGALADGLDKLHDGLVQAGDGSARLAAAQRTFAGKLGELSSATQQLADGAARLPAGVDGIISQTGRLSSALRRAGGYLTTVNRQAGSPDAAGFYLPAAALDRADFAVARSLFLSGDGRIARLQVIGNDGLPGGRAGIARYQAVRAAAEQAIRRTPLDGAHVLTTGADGFTSDLQDYLAEDARFAVIAVLLIVFVVLVLTLRAIIAPLYLLASVILSCAAALGLTTLVYQHLLGQQIQFNVAVFSFVLLVAVGADYNILLMSRMRESGARLTHAAVADAVSATGPVITSAGVIFASTFVALIASPLQGLAQTGFAVAVGVLLDTLVVRTLLVPACAAVFGQLSWWPGRQSIVPEDAPATTEPAAERFGRGPLAEVG